MCETVLAKLERPFEKILLKYREKINERNELGQTPLHLGAGWGFATRKLLSAGAAVDIEDNFGDYPIGYASSLDDLESVQFLLAADSCVPFPTRDEIINCYRRSEAIMTPLKQKIFDLFLKALVNRRTRLADLAKKTLLPQDFSRLVELSPGLLDGNAAEVYQLIKDSGYPVPFALKVPGYHNTVFHHPLITSNKMEKLYQAGFRDIDLPDDTQKTPFMLAVCGGSFMDADIVHWLLSRGADPMKRVGKDPVGQISYVAVAVAGGARFKMRSLNGHGVVCYSDPEEISDSIFDEFAPYVRLLFHNSHPTTEHACQCVCSQDSCTPFSVLLQHIWRKARVQDFMDYSCTKPCQSRWKNPQKYTKSVSPGRHPCLLAFRYPLAIFGDWILRNVHGPHRIPEISFDQIIRSFLFAELELTHTCCKIPEEVDMHRFESRFPNEVIEIQDEEKELILKLDSLCAEAKVRRKTFQGPFCDFLMDFIHEIDERETEKVSIEDARELREIGVVLDPDCIEA